MKIKADIGVILRRLSDQKDVEIIKSNVRKDHMQMIVNIASKLSVSKFMYYLKVY